LGETTITANLEFIQVVTACRRNREFSGKVKQLVMVGPLLQSLRVG